MPENHGPKPIVQIIQWVDSTVQEHQVDKNNFPKPSIITSVGFIAEETRTYITLARDIMGEGDYRGLCSIPKILILEEE